MALNALSLIIDVTDPGKAGIYQNFENNLPANLPTFIRNDGVPVTLRFVQPSVTSTRPWDDVDLHTYAVALALGVFDATPTSGSFLAQAGPTTVCNTHSNTTVNVTGSTTGIVNGMLVAGPGIVEGTTCTISGSTVTLSQAATATATGVSLFFYNQSAELAYNIDAADLQTALNALGNISTAGGVTVQELTVGAYIVTFNNPGPQNLIAADTSGLNPNTAMISSRVVDGSATAQEQQLLQLVVTPYALCDSWTQLPGAAAIVTNVQTGTGSLPSIQSINLNPAPYDGTFQITTNLGTTGAISSQATAAQVQTALNAISGGAYTVVGNTAGPWTITNGTNGTIAAFTVNVSNLLVPVGLSGILTLATFAMVEAFIAAGTPNLALKLECQVIPAGGEQNTVLQLSTNVNKNVINTSQIIPTPTANYLTAAQIAALYLPLAGGTMGGALNMGANQINDVADPTSAQDAATKNYVDTHSGSTSYQVKTGNYNLVAGDRIAADSTGGTFTLTLPTATGSGAEIDILDPQASWFTNNVTVAGTVNGATNLILNVAGGSVRLVDVGGGAGWRAN